MQERKERADTDGEEGIERREGLCPNTSQCRIHFSFVLTSSVVARRISTTRILFLHSVLSRALLHFANRWKTLRRSAYAIEDDEWRLSPVGILVNGNSLC
jgi:hypothetical protein